MKQLLSILIFLFFAGGLTAQQNGKIPNTKDKVYDRRNEAESKTRPFNLSKITQPKSSYVVMRFRLEGNRLKPLRARKRQGLLPYRPSDGGPFKVEIYDANRERLKVFYQPDPTISRSCDAEGHDDAIKLLPDGAIIEILLPDLPNMASIQLESKIRDIKYNVRDLQKFIRDGK